MKAVLFDLGNTLFGSHGATTTTMGYTGAKRAYERIQELNAKAPSYTVYFAKVTAVFAKMAMASSGQKEIDIREQIRSLFADVGTTLDSALLDEALKAWYNPFSANSYLLDEARPVLDSLRAKGMTLGIISNSVWPGWLIEADLEKEKVRDRFDCVVVSSDVGQRKPSAAIFEAAFEKLSLTAADCVFVGDSVQVDVAGAQQVGMRAVLVEREQAREAGPEPDARIASLVSLESALEEIGH